MKLLNLRRAPKKLPRFGRVEQWRQCGDRHVTPILQTFGGISSLEKLFRESMNIDTRANRSLLKLEFERSRAVSDFTHIYFCIAVNGELPQLITCTDHWHQLEEWSHRSEEGF